MYIKTPSLSALITARTSTAHTSSFSPLLLMVGLPDANIQDAKEEIEVMRASGVQFALLAACHTAELTDLKKSDEMLYLTAAMQFCGFRSVVGTMWAMADLDGTDLSTLFYGNLFSSNGEDNDKSLCEKSARALCDAIWELRKKQGMTVERWMMRVLSRVRANAEGLNQNRFFSKSDGKLDENPNDDEDDSWLDEPNLETLRPEHSLEVSLTIDLSSQCLVAAFSDEPSSDTSVAALNPPEALRES
ncbi:hypothetical protein B0F90DRAFT_1915903 [Multifurca ochricompacta]|uniref:CHAT domain-containing protein n=1 Tax=Multifurca ochricompacta TaxID=376703 RepID=A0AAD4QRP6_9AGAM|nr:hypothetical protein B0F90DRAFT_1915903 [Multifurca ochricompacta]